MFTNSKLQNNSNPDANFIKIDVKTDEQKTIKLEKIGEIEKAEEYKSSINILVDLLDEIVVFFKDEKMTFDKYKEIISPIKNQNYIRFSSNELEDERGNKNNMGGMNVPLSVKKNNIRINSR